MQVYWNAINFAVHGAGIKLRLWTQFIGPITRLSHVADVQQETSLDQIISVLARVQLGSTHWVTTQNARDDDGAGNVARTGDGAVNPMIARGVHGFSKFRHSSRFTW